MQYRINKKNGQKLPVLGFGGLRFPKDKNGFIDEEKVVSLVAKAYELGITHFDTAYVYTGSECALGKAINELGIRKNVTISTKLPPYCKEASDFERYFEESLNRLQTDYVDYYFLHALNRKPRLEELMDWGLGEWIDLQKHNGRIKNIGFSSHTSFNDYEQVLLSYDWDFSMIQYNYIDEDWQAGKSGLELAASKNIPIFIMEPVRGGFLANNLPENAKRIFDSLSASDDKPSYASWALRFVLNKPEVVMALSGMNSIDQIEDNSRTASETMPNSLTDKELDAYSQVVKEIRKYMEVYCTACGYCRPCPQGVDISGCMNTLNLSNLLGLEKAKADFESNLGNGRITNCVGCGLCKKKCPQGIDIPMKIRQLIEKFNL